MDYVQLAFFKRLHEVPVQFRQRQVIIQAQYPQTLAPYDFIRQGGVIEVAAPFGDKNDNIASFAKVCRIIVQHLHDAVGHRIKRVAKISDFKFFYAHRNDKIRWQK